jgi:hypothetical protein
MFQRTLLAVNEAAALVLPGLARADEPEACEQVLQQFDGALKTATLSDEQTAPMTGLREQGLQKCNLEQGAEAGVDFQAALKIRSR